MRLRVAGLAIATLVAVLAVHYLVGIDLRDLAAITSLVISTAAMILAYSAIRENHAWNRRHLTIQLMENWNRHTRTQLDAIKKECRAFGKRPKPSIDDQTKWAENPEWTHPEWSLSEGESALLVSVYSNTQETDSRPGQLCSHLISLLNYFETLAVAYEMNVVDRSVIEQSFAPMMIDVSRYFRPFIIKLRSDLGRETWPPFMRVIADWESKRFREAAEKEARISDKRYREAIGNAPQPNRHELPPTGGGAP